MSVPWLSEATPGATSAPRAARNVIWNLAGGASAGVLSVLATPFFVARLGLASYGIVGLWITLQSMLSLLDLGIGPAVIRLIAGASGAGARERQRDVVRTLEVGYLLVGGALAAIGTMAPRMLSAWSSHGPVARDSAASGALQLIAVALAFQFPGLLYQNALMGLQAQGRMNALQVAGNVGRFGGGAIVLQWRPDIEAFLTWQVVVALLQSVAGHVSFWRLVGRDRAHVRLRLFGEVRRFAAGMALTSILAVMLANADRLVLGALAGSAALGAYALAFTAAGALQLAIQPFYRAFFPRFAELIAAGSSEARLWGEYVHACATLAAGIVPLAVVGAVLAPAVLTAWLGQADPTVVTSFRLLLCGGGAAGLVWLPAAMQQARGWTRLHAGMIAGALIIGLPLLPSTIAAFGTPAAALLWLLHGFSGLTLELWLMHRRIFVGRLGTWYRIVLVPPLVIATGVAAAGLALGPAQLGRRAGLAWAALVLVGAIVPSMWFALRRASFAVVNTPVTRDA